MTPIPRSLLPDSSEIVDGRLYVGGVDLLELAARYETPLFVYDEEQMRSRCREAVAAFGEGVAYATKAFMTTAMARLAYEEGMKLDVATGGEMFVALHAGVPADRLILHGNNKSVTELAAALDAGVGQIVIDSFVEIDRIEALVEAGASPPRVLVRLTPGIEAHTNTCRQASPTRSSDLAWPRVTRPRRLTGSKRRQRWSSRDSTHTSAVRCSTQIRTEGPWPYSPSSSYRSISPSSRSVGASVLPM